MMDEADAGESRTPLKRLGSTRKHVVFNNMRAQLSEQLKAVESRVEAQAALAGELAEYFRRRGDLEAEYSRGLDKLARTMRARRHIKHGDEEWGLVSTRACWERLAEGTAALGREHAALAEVFGARAAARLAAAAERATRLHRRARDLAAAAHADILRVLADLHAAVKSHAALATDWRAAAHKLAAAARARAAAVAAASGAPLSAKKLKPLDKELDKRRAKHAEARLRALRARGEYELCLDAANSTITKYFSDDLADIIHCIELGYHESLSHALRTHASADEGRARALQRQAQALGACVAGIDPRGDRTGFLAAHRPLFEPPRPLRREDDGEAEADEADGADDVLAREAAARLQALEAQLHETSARAAEAAKTLAEAERTLHTMMDAEDWDASGLFGTITATPATPASPDTVSPAPTGPTTPLRLETEDFYLTKLAEYLSTERLGARLGAQAAGLRARAGTGGGAGVFSAPLESHLAATRRELPLVLTSCCRVVQLFGLRHQGIFRVSGSHADIAALRAEFEAGRDPLARVADASDINSVAALLKLYLRELRPPLFPLAARDTLLAVAQLEERAFVPRMRALVLGLPRAAFLTLRYLFAFLSHLAEYSEENMMDAWNLAICFGPTLLPVSDERDQVSRQNTLNELVKRLILHHAAVFPQTEPPLYRRHLPPPPPERGVVICAPSNGGDEDSDRPTHTAADDDEAGEAEAATGAAARCGGGAGAATLQETESEARSGEEAETPPAEQVDVTGDTQLGLRSTPDLVVDLPPGSEPPPASPPATSSAADTFLAAHNTLKRRVSPPAAASPSEATGAVDRAGEADGDGSERSPVPARNTQRVAARFADLALTGGSKPSAPPPRRPAHDAY